MQMPQIFELRWISLLLWSSFYLHVLDPLPPHLVALCAHSPTNYSFPLQPLSQADSYTEGSLNKLIFVSCCKQDHRYPEMVDSINSQNADAFIWMGDAIYSKPPYPEGLKIAYDNIGPDYESIKSHHLFIDGTWDDHDFGDNDADGTFKHKEESQKLYLDFLDIPSNSPRRNRKGVYSSHVFGSNSKSQKQVKLILLDTRYHRDVGIFPNMSAISSLPVMVLLNSVLRWLTSFLGIKPAFTGDILGEAQWLWLESQLAHSQASIHIIVSSIQIGTSIPFVENWGHYPKARERLFALMQDYNPKGLIFLSGDVHYSEMIGTENGVIEATSSGMTHSLNDHFLTKWPFYNYILPFFSQHRNQIEDYFMEKNFGVLSLHYYTGGISVNITIHDTYNQVRLHVTQKFKETEDLAERYKSLMELPHIINRLSTIKLAMRILLLCLCIFWSIQILIILLSITSKFILRCSLKGYTIWAK